MTANCQRWWTRMMVAGWVALAACSFCQGATSWNDNLGVLGKYLSSVAAPDSLTTTDPQGGTLQVTGGAATPVRPSDWGLVQLTSMSGPTAVFSGRSTDWGCAYLVNGVWVATSGTGPPSTWTKNFADVDPCIVMEINDGSGGDAIFLGGTGILNVWVLNMTGTVQVDLSADTTGIVSGLPSSIYVTAGWSTPTGVTLTGQSGGQTTITGSATLNYNPISTSQPVAVLGFTPTLTPDDMFDPKRSLVKVGVCETGSLGVQLAPGTKLSDLIPLTWAAPPTAPFTITLANTATGTARFTAGVTYAAVILTLTDGGGHVANYAVTVVPPIGTRMTRVDNNVWHNQGSASAGIALYYWLDPKDVSFHNVTFGEDACPATNVLGILP